MQRLAIQLIIGTGIPRSFSKMVTSENGDSLGKKQSRLTFKRTLRKFHSLLYWFLGVNGKCTKIWWLMSSALNRLNFTSFLQAFSRGSMQKSIVPKKENIARSLFTYGKNTNIESQKKVNTNSENFREKYRFPINPYFVLTRIGYEIQSSRGLHLEKLINRGTRTNR